MNTADLIRALEREYHGIAAANPDWKKTLAQFLEERGLSRDEIWEHRRHAAEDENWPIPDWL